MILSSVPVDIKRFLLSNYVRRNPLKLMNLKKNLITLSDLSRVINRYEDTISIRLYLLPNRTTMIIIYSCFIIAIIMKVKYRAL